MKKLVILVFSLLTSIMANAQARYAEFWGSYNYSTKKKALKGDSVLFLAKSTDEGVYHVYKKGKMIDVLSRTINPHLHKRIRIKEQNGKFYIGNYVVLLDSSLMKEIKSLYNTHFSHSSHTSHFSQIHNSHLSHSSHASHYSSSY